MENDALKALEGLADIERAGKDDAAAMQKAATSYDGLRSSSGEASFALPEALVSAVGAGFILGPVGGILLGAAQGILGKQAKQNAIDQYARESDALKDTKSVFSDEIDRLALTTDNERDQDQLSAMRAQLDAASKLALSGSPELQQQGAGMIGDISARINEFAIAQESQQIAADTAQQQRERDMDAQQLSTYNSLMNGYRADSALYNETMQTSKIALDALSSGSPADLMIAINSVQRTIDPGGVVRPEDAKAYTALGSAWERGKAVFDKYASGQSISPKNIQDLKDALYSIRATATDFQIGREASYVSQAFNNELPTRFISDFQTATHAPLNVSSRSGVALPSVPSDDIPGLVEDGLNKLDPGGQAREQGKELFSGVRSWWGERREEWDTGLERIRARERQQNND